MAVTQESSAEAYRCPDCDGALVFERMWTCTDCGYVPNQSAD
jgi:ribosomal protein L37AE/L43A